jgi:hypothetical protein
MASILKKRKGVIVRPLVAKLVGVAPDISNIPAVQWGREHELVAKRAFVEQHGSQHHTLKVTDTGLIIHEANPILAATPDALVSCDCCTPAILEIKCPYSIRDQDVLVAWDQTGYLQKGQDGEITLKESHKYYSQIQGQMAIAKVQRGYCVNHCWSSTYFRYSM